jgi:hypothetical protein
MNKLKELITQSVAKNKSLSPLTMRVPDEVLSFIEEFSENFVVSRQEVMLTLLETGIAAAKVELNNQGQADIASNFHILNTNKANTDYDQIAMLSEGIAAAFYDPWKFNINRINTDDWVFLYENLKGIIAYGQGTGNTLVKDHEGNSGECHYQKLKGFTVLPHPLPAKEIKKILGRNQIFLRTMSAMPDGEKVLNKLKQIMSE